MIEILNYFVVHWIKNKIAPLRILFKSVVNTFIDILVLSCLSSSLVFNSVSLVLYQETFLFKFLSSSSKSVFFTKSVTSGISVLLSKFGCANLASKFSDVNLLNSWVVILIYLSWSVVILFSVSLIFCVLISFLNH